MKLISLLKRPFRVEYRLTVIASGKSTNTYRQCYGLRDCRRQKGIFANLGRNANGVEYWSLYKKGPFGLPEREVDFGCRSEEATKV